MTRAVSISFV